MDKYYLKTGIQALSGQLLSDQDVTLKPSSISGSHSDTVVSHVHTNTSGFGLYISAALTKSLMEGEGKCHPDTPVFPGE